MTTLTALKGQLLVAMPGMGDPRFDGAVVFLCSHEGDPIRHSLLTSASARTQVFSSGVIGSKHFASNI